MPDKKNNVLKKSYQPTVSQIGNSYKPVLTGNVLPIFVPPKGGTGVRSVEIKVVTVSTEKKKITCGG